MIYLDSNIFIIAMASEDQKRIARARALLGKVRDGKESVITASLTLDEVLWVVKQKKGKAAAKAAGQALMEFPNLKIADVNREVLGLALELFDRYDLSPRDSIHAACAIINKIPVIISEDSDFDRVKELQRKHL